MTDPTEYVTPPGVDVRVPMEDDQANRSSLSEAFEVLEANPLNYESLRALARIRKALEVARGAAVFTVEELQEKLAEQRATIERLTKDRDRLQRGLDLLNIEAAGRLQRAEAKITDMMDTFLLQEATIERLRAALEEIAKETGTPYARIARTALNEGSPET